MKIKELSVSVSRKVNLGNYESEGVCFSATAELSENEDFEGKKAELLESLQCFLEQEVIRIKGNHSARGAGELVELRQGG